MISSLKMTEGIVMPSCTYFKTFILALGLTFVGIANSTFSAPADESVLEKIIIPISSAPQFTFTMQMKSKIEFSLLTNKNTKDNFNLVGKITVSDQDCALGHQVSVSYDKKSQEILTTYFPKEIPWGTTYTLKVSRDAKANTLTLNLNGDIISVTPYQKAKFIYLIKNPEIINILDIEQH